MYCTIHLLDRVDCYGKLVVMVSFNCISVQQEWNAKVFSVHMW